MADSRRMIFEFMGRDNVSRTMQQIGRNSEGLSSKFGSMGAKMGGALKGGALALGTAAGAAVVFGVKTAASMEQAQVAFTTMLGSASKAKTFLGDLQKFAAATPFELPQLTKASQRLLAFGFSAKDVIPTLTAIGDAVAGLGGSAEQIDQVTTAIGQMQAKGKIQSDELLQLTEAGIPALKILANGFHKSTGEMQDMVTKGLVPANKAIPMLLSGIENGTKGAAGQTTKFAGMMKAQSATLAGMWSTLKDNVSQALGNMITPFMPALKSGLTGLVSLTGKLSAGMTAFGKFAKSAGREVMAGFKFGKETGDLVRSVSRLREVASQLGAAYKKVADWTRGTLIPALRDLSNWFQKKIMPVIAKFSREVLKEAVNQIRRVARELQGSNVNWRETARVVGKVAEAIYKVAGPVMTWFYKIVLKSLGTAIILAIKQIKLIIWFIGDAAKRFKTGGQAVIDFGKASREAFTKMKDVAVRVFLQIAQTFLKMVSTLVTGAAKAFGWVPGLGPKLKRARDAVNTFKDQVNADIRKITDGKTVRINVKALAGGVVDAGSAVARNAFGAAKGGPVPALWAGATEAYDSQPVLARVNEHIWTPEEVKAVGGHGKMFKLRDMARRGLLQGLAGGGPVGMNIRAVTENPHAAIAKIETGIGNILVKFATKMAAVMSGGSVVQAARSMIGYPYSWGGGGKGGPSYGIGRGAHTYGFDCSGLAEYAWWKGRHIGIGGVTGEQWAHSRPISGPRPGALAFPHGPDVHVMIGSNRPGYVIQAPFTGSFVQEVPRSSGNWRWPIGAYFGGPVGQFGARALRGTRDLGRLAKALGIVGRAGGGLVRARTPYLVGEHSPELFVPDSAGYISPFRRSSAPYSGLERSATPFGWLEKGSTKFPAPRRTGSGSGGGGGDALPDITKVVRIGTVNHIAQIAKVATIANVANVNRMAPPARRPGTPLLTPDHAASPLERSSAPYRRALDRASGEIHVHLHMDGQPIHTKQEIGRYLISAIDQAIAGGGRSAKLVTK